MINPIYSPAPERYDNGMKFRRCGQSGILLPEISLGLWHNFGDMNTFANSQAMAHYAFDRGITHFDLANNYAGAWLNATRRAPAQQTDSPEPRNCSPVQIKRWPISVPASSRAASPSGSRTPKGHRGESGPLRKISVPSQLRLSPWSKRWQTCQTDPAESCPSRWSGRSSARRVSTPRRAPAGPPPWPATGWRRRSGRG